MELEDECDERPGPKLTEMQQAFVTHFTSTPGSIGNASEAARRAGYSEKSAGELGRQLLEKPHVCRAIDIANRRSVSGPLATKAIEVLHRIIHDEATPAKLQIEAAKTILDRAGIVASVAEDDRRRDFEQRPSLSEMSNDELEEVIRRGQETLATGSKPVPSKQTH
jgi:phage terminase small subunit